MIGSNPPKFYENGVDPEGVAFQRVVSVVGVEIGPYEVGMGVEVGRRGAMVPRLGVLIK